MKARNLAELVVVALVAGVAVSAASLANRRTDSSSVAMQASGSRTTVVAELFTSEGCSSCPPADELLRTLVATQPIEGVEILVLGEHVDYWDRLGWRDPFSSAAFSQRQSAYDAAVFRSQNIYTPQLVVNGTSQGVGSDRAVVERLIRASARQPHGTLTLTATPSRPSAIHVAIHAEMPAGLLRHGAADLVVAVTEDNLVSRVSRGENRGRVLSHGSVVRSLTTVARLDATDTSSADARLITVDAGWALRSLRIVGFVQEQGSRRILGAGSATVALTGEQ